MLRRRNALKGSSEKQTQVNYMSTCLEDNPVPDPSLLDPVDSVQHEGILPATNDMLLKAISNSLFPEREPCLLELVDIHINLFRASCPLGSPGKFPPLEINLLTDDEPVHCRSRKYSQDKRQWLAEFVTSLVGHGMAFFIKTYKWASAPVLVPKPGT